jgi:hypothetical protein
MGRYNVAVPSLIVRRSLENFLFCVRLDLCDILMSGFKGRKGDYRRFLPFFFAVRPLPCAADGARINAG